MITVWGPYKIFCAPARTFLFAGFLLLFLSLAACEEDVAGPSGVNEPFSLYGVFNPGLSVQTVFVAPVEDLLAPESGDPLDAIITSTDLGSGKTYVWRDSVVANATGQLDHVYWADFTPEYGSRHRMDAVRSDGKKSVVHVEVPGEVRIESSDAPTRNLRVTVSGASRFALVRFDVTYSVRYYDRMEPDEICSSPLKRYTFPYQHHGIALKNSWRVDIDLNSQYDTIRSYYHDDTEIEYLENPVRDGPALMGMWLDVTVGSPEWDPPESDFSDERTLVHPGTLSNVENGYGLVVGGYNDEAALYPSSKAVDNTWFFDFIQRGGGDYCLGTL